MGKLRSAWKRWREARTKGSAIRPFRPCMKSLYMYHPPPSPEELEGRLREKPSLVVCAFRYTATSMGTSRSWDW